VSRDLFALLAITLCVAGFAVLLYKALK